MSFTEIQTLGSLTLEGAASILIGVIAYKLYKARVDTHSSCCIGRWGLETHNAGSHDPEASAPRDGSQQST